MSIYIIILYIAVSDAVIRGNSCKLVKHRIRLNVRKYFYINRAVNVWNCLNENVVCSRICAQIG